MKINKKNFDEHYTINEFIYRNKHSFDFFSELHENNILFNYKKNNSDFDLEIDALSILIPHNGSSKNVAIIFELKDFTKHIFKNEKSKKIESFICDFKNNLVKYKEKIFYEKFSIYGFLIFLENENINFTLFSLNNQTPKMLSYKNYSNINNKLNMKKYYINTNPCEFIEFNITKAKDISYYLKCFDSQETPLSNSELKELSNKIIKSDFIFINGYAGTKKTSLAFYLFGELENSCFLLINKGFYDSLMSGSKDFNFKKNNYSKIQRFFHFHTNNFTSLINDEQNNKKFKYLIIDEYQRCNDETISLIKTFTSKGGKIILLGDEHQAINPNSDNLNLKEKLLAISENKGYKVCEHKLLKYYRLPKTKIDFILFLLNLNSQKCKYKTSNIDIKIINDYDSFVKSFKMNNKIEKSCIVTIQYLNCIDKGFYEFEKRGIKLSNSNEPCGKNNFLIDQNMRQKYCFFPYDVISREMEAIYIFLPKDLEYNNSKKEFTFLDFFKDNKKYIKNQLYVLLTRATRKIILLIENESTLNLFQAKMRD